MSRAGFHPLLRRFLFGGAVYIAKSALTNCPFSASATTTAITDGSDTISESCAFNYALSTTGAAGSISGSCSDRQVKRTEARYICGFTRFAFALDAVRITKSTGLNFLRRQIRCRRR